MSWPRGVLRDRAGLRDAAALYPLDRLGAGTVLGAVQLLAGRGAVRRAGVRRLLQRLLGRGAEPEPPG